MKIFLATKNKGKITEFQQILSKMDVELVTCQDIDVPDVEETGSTFVENAILKMATPMTTGNINTAVKQGDNIRGGDQILIQNNTSSVTDSLQVDR